MERISRGFRLLGASLQVLRADKELLVLPLISFAALVVVVTPLLAVAFATGISSGEDLRLSTLQYVFLGVAYFIASFIGIFSNAAIVGAATIRLEGGDPTVKDGLRIAFSKVDKIIGWAALTATVGIVLRAIEERVGILGRIVIAVVGAAWGVITFFVVPVLLYEPLGVMQAVKRSATIFKERWGEQFTGNISIGLATVLVAVPVFVVAFLLGVVSPLLGVAVGVLAMAALMVVTTAVTGIFNAALYHYATTGSASGPFGEEDLRGAFRPKQKGFFGR